MKHFLLSLLTVALSFTLGACACGSKSPKSSTLEERFKSADTNKDGKLSKPEFRNSMIEQAFVLFDTNKDGSITLEEFVSCGGSATSFKKIDINGNGVITLEEAKGAKIAIDNMTAAFFGADVDKDGYVTLGEALAYREKVRAVTR